MKTIQLLTSALVAAGSAGVALVTLSGRIPSEIGLATLTVAGIFGFALFDYARPVKSLRPLVPVLRPSLPVAPGASATRRVAAAVKQAA